MTQMFKLWVLDEKTKTKRPVVDGPKTTFTRTEKSRVAGKLIRAGHVVEVEPVKRKKS